MSDWIDVKEAAAYAKCGTDAIYKGVKDRKLRAVRVGTTRLRFIREWIDAWLLATATGELVNPEAPGPDRALTGITRH